MSTHARSIPLRAGADAAAPLDPAGASSAGRRYAYGAAAIVAVALAFRLTRLGANSFWVDEINVATFVRSGHLLTDLRNRGGPFEPPLHFVAVWLALGLPLGFETAARVPAALFGALEVLALILFARRVTGRRDLPLLAGALLAVAPFAIRYSQENRYYTTFSALQLLSWWLCLRALDRRRPGDFVVWGLALAALLLAHPFAPLVALAQILGAWWWLRRETRACRLDDPAATRRLRLTALVAVGVALPWFLWGAVQWIPDLIDGHSYALNARGRARVTLGVDLFRRVSTWVLGNSGRMTPLVIVLLVSAAAAPFVARPSLRNPARCIAGYTLGFFLALVPLAWTIRTPIEVRRLEFLVAPAVLLAVLAFDGVGATFRAHGRTRTARVVAHLVPLALVVLSLIATVAYYGTEKSDYRGLARVVGAAAPQDLVVIGPIDERWERSIDHYLAWSGVHRPVHYVVAGHPPPRLAVPPGAKVVWVTPSRPDPAAFPGGALNSVPDMQVIAGDKTAPAAILPWFTSVTRPANDAELAAEEQTIHQLPVVSSPPASSAFPWWLLTGR